MRHHRAVKFAEYLSTYAILHQIGLHPTVLVEKKDPSAGFGIFVRDACDAGTTILVLPSRRCASNSVLRIIGTPISFSPISCFISSTSTTSSSSCSSSSTTTTINEHHHHNTICTETLENGLISTLMNVPAKEWMEWCWRVSLEAHRSYSPFWGWLSALPSGKEMKEKTNDVARQCRLHYPSIAPHYEKGWNRFQEEMARAYSLLEPVTLTAPPATFFWAGLVLVSRGLRIPQSWRSPHHRHCRHHHSTSSSSFSSSSRVGKQSCTSPVLQECTASEMGSSSSPFPSPSSSKEARQQQQHQEVEIQEVQVNEEVDHQGELGVIPYIDLINGPDERGRSANARIEIALTPNELPEWYLSYLREEKEKEKYGGGRGTGSGSGGGQDEVGGNVNQFLSRLFDAHFCACVTLEKPLRPAEEVILDYSTFSSGRVSTGGALNEDEEVLLTRFLHFLY